MKESVRMVVVLTVIAMASGFILAQVYHWTYPTIQRNRAQALAGSILAVLPVLSNST